MVWYNSKRNTWYCLCSKGRVSCIHKCVAKWYLFQTKRDLFITNNSEEDDPHSPVSSDTGESPVSSFEKQSHAYPPVDQDLRQMVRYIYKYKRLPAVLPQTVTKHVSERELLPTELFPKETFCAYCPRSIALLEPIKITGKARILTLTSVIEGLYSFVWIVITFNIALSTLMNCLGFLCNILTTFFAEISTFCRRCPQCNLIYRYQEWSDGLHNYNDHIIMSLQLCLFLRSSIEV